MSNKFDTILHPVRMRIVAEISERQVTSRELAAALPDIAQATLYRHIKRLLTGGILRIVREQAVNGAIERTYALVSEQNRISHDEVAEISAEDHIKYFSIFAAGLIDNFARYVRQSDPAQFRDEGMSYNQSIIHLSSEERAALERDLAELLSPILRNGPAPDRKPYTLSSVVIPDKRGDQ